MIWPERKCARVARCLPQGGRVHHGLRRAPALPGETATAPLPALALSCSGRRRTGGRNSDKRTLGLQWCWCQLVLVGRLTPDSAEVPLCIVTVVARDRSWRRGMAPVVVSQTFASGDGSPAFTTTGPSDRARSASVRSCVLSCAVGQTSPRGKGGRSLMGTAAMSSRDR